MVVVVVVVAVGVFSVACNMPVVLVVVIKTLALYDLL